MTFDRSLPEARYVGDLDGLARHFEDLLKRMHFHDLGSCFIRGTSQVRLSYAENTVYVDQFYMDESSVRNGDLDAFLDVLISDAVNLGFSIVFELPGTFRASLVQFGFKNHSDVVGAVIFEPGASSVQGAAYSFQTRVLRVFTAILATLSYWRFLG
jgi:hypothetical protein